MPWETHKLVKMWTSIYSYVNWCSEACHTSFRWYTVQTKTIIVITALIVCCNCFEESNYHDGRYKRMYGPYRKKKEIHLAGIFPINGDKGWQGGQVGFNCFINKLDDEH